MEKAIFFDRDNTLIINDGYIGNPAEVKLVPGAAHAIALLRQQSYKIVVTSNQAGVAHGFYTEADVDLVNAEIARQLQAEHPEATVDAFYSCFHHDKPKTNDPALLAKYRHPDHPDRKPNPGMLLRGAVDFHLDLHHSWMVGDSIKDVEAGQAAGCRTVLLEIPSLVASPDVKKGNQNTRPDYSTQSWEEVFSIIQQAGPRMPISPPGI